MVVADRNLARALEAAASEHAGRVKWLAEQVAAGRYRVDARAVSRAIVAEMRTAVVAAEVPAAKPPQLQPPPQGEVGSAKCD